MKKILILLPFIIITGCARSSCQIAIDNLQPAAKIPKQANIEIAERILADDGGNVILKSYVTMSHQINDIISECQKGK